MSELTFYFSNDVIDFVSNLEAKQVRQVWNKITALKKEPRPNNSKHLSGYPGLFRIPIGEFRCVYEHNSDGVRIIVIDRRNDDKVYQELKRKI